MENINLIRKIAWSFHKTTGLEWDDLFQEAAMSYLRMRKNHDPKKAKLSTYMWRCISTDLTDYWTKQRRRSGPLCSLDMVEERSVSPTMLFESLTEEAQEVANIILSTPSKYLGSPTDARLRLTRILRRRGWSLRRIQQGFQDLTIGLQ
jgi:DNA-directed RNA polymerase specialized sigma subunit